MDGGAWVNLCRNGGYNTMHNHPACSWPGVYYVSTGERDPAASKNAGSIEFLDPRMGATSVGLNGPGALPKLKIDPVGGILFLSGLGYHRGAIEWTRDVGDSEERNVL